MNKYIFRERKPKLPFRIEKQIPCNVFPLVFVFFGGFVFLMRFLNAFRPDLLVL